MYFKQTKYLKFLLDLDITSKLDMLAFHEEKLINKTQAMID